MKKHLFLLLLAVAASMSALWAYDFQSGDLYYNILTDKTNEVEVTRENEDYPYWSTEITSADIPSSVTYNGATYSVTSIGSNAFYECTGLTSVTIPNSVTSIGEEAFTNCSSLTSVTIPNSVTSIGGSAFAGCTGLTSIIVESGNTFYDSRNDCNAIIETATNTLIAGCQNTIIPNSVTTIGDNAFYECSGLTSVTIGNSVTTIGRYAFHGCTGLTSVTIPNSVTSIEEGTFSVCSSLTSVTIPNSVTSIEGGAFSGCSSLTSVTIPNSVTSIGDYAFAGCTGLTSVTIPNSVTSIGDGAFASCRSLTSVTIPNSVTSIEPRAFYSCWSLTSITIPNSVTSIGKEAFSYCSSLATLELPASLKVIEASAFEECEGLKTITCYGQRPPTVKEKALESVPYSTIVYVPADYLSTYKMHDVWGLYDVRPLGAATVDTQDMAVTPHENTADIVWPTNSSASTYELVISKDGEVICTLIFNANGQLTSIAFAPARYDNSRAPEQTEQSGFSFTVTGLNPGTTYNYTLTVKDAAGKALDTKTGTFTTEGETATEDVIGSQTSIQKIFEDGKLYILLPDGTRYDATGKRVK